MTTSQIFATSLLLGSVITPMLAADLSSYRSFQFGMSPSAVLKQTGINPPEIRVIHKAPALLEEIEWNPQRYSSTSAEPDSVKEIRFSFYNGGLFQMTVAYDRYKTEGLTANDLIEAISSSSNSTATYPNTEIIFPSTYNENVKVIARWEDPQYSFNLVRFDYEQGFAMVLFSKEAESKARVATIHALKLEQQEAPQREIELQKKQEQERRTQQEKARLLNKPGFRP